MADSYNSPNSGFNHEYRRRFEVRRPAKPPEKYAKLNPSKAMERWGKMRENTLEHFKFTPRTTTYCIIWAGLVPFALWQLIKWEKRYRWKLAGKPERPMF